MYFNASIKGKLPIKYVQSFNRLKKLNIDIYLGKYIFNKRKYTFKIIYISL